MKSLKQRIIEEMLIDDEFAYDLTKQLYFSGRLNPQLEGISFDELYFRVKKRIKELEQAEKEVKKK